jgi:hypothetical protein
VGQVDVDRLAPITLPERLGRTATSARLPSSRLQTRRHPPSREWMSLPVVNAGAPSSSVMSSSGAADGQRALDLRWRERRRYQNVDPDEHGLRGDIDL